MWKFGGIPETAQEPSFFFGEPSGTFAGAIRKPFGKLSVASPDGTVIPRALILQVLGGGTVIPRALILQVLRWFSDTEGADLAGTEMVQ